LLCDTLGLLAPQYKEMKHILDYVPEPNKQPDSIVQVTVFLAGCKQ
jgi:hypothetical protein